MSHILRRTAYIKIYANLTNIDYILTTTIQPKLVKSGELEGPKEYSGKQKQIISFDFE